METSRIIVCIPKEDICYFQWIIESYDGMANMSTIDPAKGEVQISVTPDCKEEILSLIKYLKEEERIHVSKERFI
jgi:hypothetical protein